MKYLIKKGKHYAKFTINRLFPFVGRKIGGKVKFDMACLTEAKPSGWNKLTGITGFSIHKNSGRLVWRSDGSKILIAGYVYNKGVRKDIKFTSVMVDRFYNFSINQVGALWAFSIDDKVIRMDGDIGFWKLRAYPYFGGRAVAPCEMVITIKT